MAERVRPYVQAKVTQWMAVMEDRLQQSPYHPFESRILRRFNKPPVMEWIDPKPKELEENSIRVFVTGHSVDHHLKPGWTPRFPDTPEAIETARERIHRAIGQIYDEAVKAGKDAQFVVCSGMAGMDLLALEKIGQLMESTKADATKPKVSARVFLGYDKASFIKDSVAVGDKQDNHTGETLKGYTSAHQQMWLDIFTPFAREGMVIEPQFRDEQLRSQHPSPTHDVIKQEVDLYYGGQRKVFDELNDHMVGYLRKGDYVVALWDGNQGFAPGGTPDAIYKGAKRVGKRYVKFIDPQGIINPERLTSEDQPTVHRAGKVRRQALKDFRQRQRK